MATMTYVPSRIGEGFFLDVPAPGSGDNTKSLTYNHATGNFVYTAFDAAGTAAAAVAAHVAAGDPHAQYELESNNTAAAILTKVLTVDGAGSGLDADLLDGQSSAAFLRASGADTGGTEQLQSFNNGVRSDSGLSVGINPINALTLHTAVVDNVFGATIYNENTTGTAARAGLALNNSYYNALMALNGAGVTQSGYNSPSGFAVLNSGPGGIDFAATHAAGRIGFWASSAKGIEITSSGKVGIGTDTPNSKLEVAGTIQATDIITGSMRPASNSTTALQLQDASGTALLIGDTTNLRVGIGTTSPNNKLDVAGTIQADGLRLDVTPTSETITPTHTITISLNGTNYKIPCALA